MRRWAGMGLLLWAGAAVADAGEAGLRPFFEVRRGALAHPDGARAPADGASLGGGLLLSYGLSFSWSLTARYGLDLAGRQSVSLPDGQVAEWQHRRHLALAGVSWAPSDRLTPVVIVEGGVALQQLTEAYTLDGGGAVDEPLADATQAVPVVRATVGLEWRISDFWSITPSALVEHAGGLGYGAQLMLGGYTYL